MLAFLYTTLNSLENLKNLDYFSMIFDHNEPLHFTNSRLTCETEIVPAVTGIPENCNTRLFPSQTQT